MKSVGTVFHWCLVLAVFWALSLALAHADVEWHIAKELKLESEPLDIAQSQDEKSIFILVRGKILVYSFPEDRVKEAIPVDEAFDRLRVSPKGDFLILGSGSEKTLNIIQFKIIQEIDISGLPYRGPKDAPVTIAVFSDYQWPYCARLEPLFQQVLDRYPREVKLVFKNFPLNIHPFARKAAAAALAAHRQEKFREAHEKLFEKYETLNDSVIQGIAAEIGLDVERFNRDMASAPIQGIINRDMNDARALGVRGIPTVFINGKRLKERSPRGFQIMIDAALQKGK